MLGSLPKGPRAVPGSFLNGQEQCKLMDYSKSVYIHICSCIGQNLGVLHLQTVVVVHVLDVPYTVPGIFVLASGWCINTKCNFCVQEISYSVEQGKNSPDFPVIKVFLYPPLHFYLTTSGSI